MKKKFTLIELIITIAVIILLSGLAIPKIIGVKRDGEVARLVNDIDSIEKIIPVYENKYGNIPVKDKINFSILDSNLIDLILSNEDNLDELYNLDFNKVIKYASNLGKEYNDGDYIVSSKGNVYYKSGKKNSKNIMVYTSNFTNYTKLVLSNLTINDDHLYNGIELTKSNAIINGKIDNEEQLKIYLNGDDVSSQIQYKEKVILNEKIANIYASNNRNKKRMFSIELNLKDGKNEIKFIISDKNKECNYNIYYKNTENNNPIINSDFSEGFDENWDVFEKNNGTTVGINNGMMEIHNSYSLWTGGSFYTKKLIPKRDIIDIEFDFVPGSKYVGGNINTSIIFRNPNSEREYVHYGLPKSGVAATLGALNDTTNRTQLGIGYGSDVGIRVNHFKKGYIEHGIKSRIKIQLDCSNRELRIFVNDMDVPQATFIIADKEYDNLGDNLSIEFFKTNYGVTGVDKFDNIQIRIIN
ncbi:type II secretion system protein [Alkaliphilus sp. B6464]|uniref:type II secretion system protein n=1 Tax=Alkaliphilus sp. B6464 TaxID=2731219 RepID=UPI001BA5B63D|nr:type II secretion system protein [Alkaliphilus sp. B6464]QUH22172.1 type II secretion system protein [Alkaliphilus sp. B6464]